MKLEEGWDDVWGGLPPYLQVQGDCMLDSFKNVIDSHIEALLAAQEKVENLGLEPGSREHRKAYALTIREFKGVDVSAVMSCYGQGPENLIDWFHHKSHRDPSMRAKHVKRVTKMKQQEMGRNGTTHKAFWEVKEEENEEG